MTNFFTQSLWRDEAFSVLLADRSVSEIIGITARDASPPLYYILLHYWMLIFGSSEIAARALSVITFLPVPIILFFAVRELIGNREALAAGVAAVAALLNPLLFYYAAEARAYSLFCLLAALATFLLIKRRWALYAIVIALGLYTHNLMAMLALAHFAAALLVRSWRGRLRSVVVSLSAAGLLYLPWLPTFFSQAKRIGDSFWIEEFGLREVGLALGSLIAGPKITWLSVPLAALFVITLVAGFSNRRRVFSIALPALIILFVPLAAVGLVSLYRPLFLDRYLIFSVIPLALLLGIAVSGPSAGFRRLARIAAAVVLILSLATDTYIFTHPTKPPIREAVALIKENYQEGDLIFNRSALTFFETDYYLRYNEPVLDVPNFINNEFNEIPHFVGRALIEENRARGELPQAGRLWLVGDDAGLELRQLPLRDR